ncbi:MAG: phosphotransferase [Candidatus Dormibacteraeota bacterium]|nr:phosphotransferase [Candidatus Dormibacteraeota bacterium]
MSVGVDHLAILDRIRGWAGLPRTSQPLGGGITNRNHLVQIGMETVVVRIPAETGKLLGIDRRVEHEASLLAAASGVGPEVVAFLEPEGILVTRFIHGEAVSDAAVHLPDTLRRVAESLRLIHHAGLVPAGFSPFRVGEAYAVTATQRGVQLPAAHERALQIAVAVEQALPVLPPLLCHNDLLNANFIDDGQLIRIVDWEYAGMGDPMFDLGNFAVNHELAGDEQAYLLEAYAGGASAARLAHLRLMCVMSDYREAMWGVVQQGISDLDFDFAGYAARHFDRLLASAGRPEFNDWLRQARP